MKDIYFYSVDRGTFRILNDQYLGPYDDLSGLLRNQLIAKKLPFIFHPISTWNKKIISGSLVYYIATQKTLHPLCKCTKRSQAKRNEDVAGIQCKWKRIY